jgi:hypothetical protein
MDESKNDRFKAAVAIMIAVVSVVGAYGGARAGLLGSIDNELTRIGQLNKVRQQQIDLSHALTALDQTLYAQQYVEQQRLAELTEAGAVEARQQGRAAQAQALEEQAGASRTMANQLRNFFYADYQRAGSGYDAATLTEDLKLSMSAREYKTLKPEDYIQRGDDEGARGIACMLALAVSSVSLVFFGLADMIGRKVKYVCVVLGVAVLILSVYMLATA